MSTRLRHRLLNAFYRMIPKRYYPRLIADLEERAFAPMDYGKHEILLAKGVRTNSCEGEPELVRYLETYLKPGQVFYDIGANVGAFALVAAKYHHGQVKVYAFEPAAANVPILMLNIMRNHCEKSIVPLAIPLAKEATMAVFNYHADHFRPGGGLHALGDAIDYDGKPFEPFFQQLMLSATIDDLVGRGYLPAPHHMKLDVDGLEFEILAGAENVLKGPVAESVFLEVGKRFDEAQLVSLLNRCGFAAIETYQHTNTANRLFAKRK